MSADSVGIQARLCAARSWPVTTATTPSSASAWLVSMLVIRAWASGLRRIAMCSMPGSRTSST